MLLTEQDIKDTLNQYAADDNNQTAYDELEARMIAVAMKIGDAQAELKRALSHLPFRPISAADAIGQAQAILQFAQSSVDTT